MNTLFYVILNVVFVVAVIVINVMFHRSMKRRQDRWETKKLCSEMRTSVEQEVKALAGSETDPDYELMVQIKRAKKRYCMAYNKENGLYCSHPKSHRSRMLWGPSIRHTTHEAKGIRWAMEE